MNTIANIFWLGTKELRSLLRDYVLMAFVVYAFSLQIMAQANSYSQEVHNAAMALVDEDHSELSRRIAGAFLPPYFQHPRPIGERDIVPLMNAGKFTFVVDIPPNFERDVLGGRNPAIQLNVDATVMVQGGLGAGYAQEIIMNEIPGFLSQRGRPSPSPVNLAVRIVSIRTSRRRGSPASWASSTVSACWRLSSPAPRSYASASTAPWIIFWSCR